MRLHIIVAPPVVLATGKSGDSLYFGSIFSKTMISLKIIC